MVDAKIVARLSLTDGDIATLKVSQMLKGFNDMDVSLEIIGHEKWMFISGKDEETPVLALQFGTQTLTAVLLFDAKEEMKDLNALLQPAANPISKKALGKLNAQTTAMAFIDNIKLLKQVLNSKNGLAKFLKTKAKDLSSEPCIEEMMGIAKSFPRIDFNVSMDDADICMDSLLSIRNDDMLADLKGILGHRTVDQRLALGELIVSLDIGKSFELLGKWGTAIKESPYQCSTLGLLNASAWYLIGLSKSKLKRHLQFVKSMTGFGLYLEAIEEFNGRRKPFFSAYMLGSEIVNTMDFNDSDSELLSKIRLQKGQISSLDLNDELGIPLIAQMLFTDHGLFITTSKDEAGSGLSQSKVTSSQDFLSFTFNDTMLNFVGEIFDRFTNRYGELVAHSFEVDCELDVTLSLVDNGLKLTSIATF